MHIFFPATFEKKAVFKEIEKDLSLKKFQVISKDEHRPWGGFLVIDEHQSKEFIETYFSSYKVEDLATGKKISPKILIVEPGKKLSWQYHHRREELWKVIGGEVGIIKSETDDEGKMTKHNSGSLIKLKQGERHRLIGLNSWGVVAEIWQHSYPDIPSDEDDIIRLQDDYGR